MARTVKTVFEFVSQARTGGAQAIRDELERLADSTDDFGDAAEDAGRKSAAAEGGIGKLGQAAKVAKMALAGLATVGIGATVFAIGQGTRDFLAAEDAMAKFQARTGVSAEELGDYKAIVEDLYKAGLGENFDEVATAMGTVRAVTGQSGDALEDTTRRALVFSDTFDRDVNESIRTAQNMMNLFGSDAADNFDLLAGMMKLTGDPAGDLLDTFNEYASTFEGLGFDATEFASILGSGLKAGAYNTDVIADGVREFGIRLKEGASDSALWSLGLSQMNVQFKRGKVSGEEMFNATLEALRGIEDPIRRNALGVQMFGSKWEDLGEEVFLALDPAMVEMEQFEGAIDDSNEAMDKTLGRTWTKFTRSVRMALTTALGPFIQKGLNVLIPLLDKAGRWMNNVGVPALMTFGVYLGQALGKVTGFAGGIINSLGGTEKIVSTLSDLFGDLVGFINSLDSGQIALLGGALLMMIGPSIISGLGNVIGLLGGVVSKFFSTGLSFSPLLLALAVVAAYETNFGGLKEKVDGLVKALKEGDLAGIMRGVADAMLAIPLGLAEEFGDLVGIDIEGGLGAWSGVFENLKTILGLLAGAAVIAWLSLRVMASDFANNIKTKIQNGVNDVVTFISELPGKVSTAASNFGAEVKTWITDKFKDAVTKIGHYVTGSGFDTFGGKVSKIVTKVSEWTTGLWDAIKLAIVDPFSNAVSEIWNWFAGDQEDSLKNKLKGLPAEIESALSGIGQAIKTKLVDPALEFLAPLINGFNKILEGIKAVGGWLGIGGEDERTPEQSRGGGGGEYLSEIKDKGGKGRARVPYLIGIRAQPELFIPDSPGTFYPRGQYSLAPAMAGAGGEGTVHNWAGATLNLYGVQDIEGLYRELKHLERRKNI